MTIFWVVCAVGAFLVGSLPFGLVVARARGVDIRKSGSGNIGATNVGRVLGFRWFLLVFVLDMLKGALPVVVAGGLAGVFAGADVTRPGGLDAQWEVGWQVSLPWLGVAAATVLGHVFSPFVGFRGGKGVATGLGAMLGVFPLLTFAGLGAFVVFSVVLAAWRYVSLASCMAAASLPLWTWWIASLVERLGGRPPPESLRGLPPESLEVQSWPHLMVTVAVAALVLLRHRENLSRLQRGVEPKVGAGKRRAEG